MKTSCCYSCGERKLREEMGWGPCERDPKDCQSFRIIRACQAAYEKKHGVKTAADCRKNTGINTYKEDYAKIRNRPIPYGEGVGAFLASMEEFYEKEKKDE